MTETRRSYNEFCGAARALDVVGERWTLLVVRNLLLGPQRYSELQRGLPGITTNLLAKRLREMEESGLVERVRAGSAEGGHAYRLTELGRGLEPVVHALGRWGWRWMQAPREGEHRSLEWLLVALRRRYRRGAPLRVEILADGAPYRLVVGGETAEVARGALPDAELRVRGPATAVARLFLEGPTPAVVGALEVEGPAAGRGLGILAESFARGEPPT